MSENSDRSLVLSAPAKLNLHLEVLGKRADGFHELETLLVTISLSDELVFEAQNTGTTTVTCDDLAAGPTEQNLVTRAIELMREETGRDDGMSVSVTKRIPIGGGLGGGSSDAATTILGLNQLWGLGWERDRLAELGGRLGSDVPYFFHGPAAVARGRGELVTDCVLGRPLDFVVVTPAEGLSTARVFESLKLDGNVVPIEPIVDALAEGNVDQIASRLHNRLQDVAMGLCEPLRRIRQEADAWQCLGHRMTGSGSSYFALCRSSAEAFALGQMLAGRGLGSVFVVRSG